MVDFPDSPLDGQYHTEEGQTWQFLDGAWAVASEFTSAVEIVEDDILNGYQVVGDVLIQWGYYTDGQHAPTITFPIEYPVGPTVQATPRRSGNTRTVHVNIPDTDSFICEQYDNNQEAATSAFYWFSIGEAPDSLKKPKTIGKVGTAEGTDPVEIAESGGFGTNVGWQVMGDLLVQWGQDGTSDAAGDISIIFPNAFANIPALGITVGSTSTTNQMGCNVRNVTEANAGVRIFRTSEAGGTDPVSGFNARWIAVGQAPDALKKVKELETIGGAMFAEYHDPAGEASWRITGKTLECWGSVLNASGGVSTITFGKTFLTPPQVQLTADANSTNVIAVSTATSPTTTGVTAMARRVSDNATSGSIVVYHAIGEWNGVV